jgi:preprotein translocase subunit SecG
MILFLTILMIICSALLVLVVLAQNPKGGGAMSPSSGSTQFIGVKKTGDILEKLTWGFAIAILTLSIVANLILKPVEAEEETPQQTEQPEE